MVLLGRPELAPTFTKINVWNQTQYEKIVFLDSDTLPIKNIDELFELSDEFSAAPDIGWPDIFNSGVFVTKPNVKTFADLKKLAVENEKGLNSFDGGDQGLLNQYFENNWNRISFTYNVTPSTSYQYEPAYRRYSNDIRVLHFIGTLKPWQTTSEITSAYSEAYKDLLSKWWGIFNKHYTPNDLIGKPNTKLFDEKNVISPSTWDATKRAPPVASKGEAYALDFEKIENVWDNPETANESANLLKKSPDEDVPPPLFPWESRPHAKAERVFYEDTHYESHTSGSDELEESSDDNKDEPKKSKIRRHRHKSSASKVVSEELGVSLRPKSKANTVTSVEAENEWNPSAQLEKLAELPSLLFSKKGEDKKDDESESKDEKK